ncbi:MAG: hypothetical protein JF589_18055 [Gemmatimonadetes bacterium]|nr:hypothetical protein [Gemmatimonadota bacterium]
MKRFLIATGVVATAGAAASAFAAVLTMLIAQVVLSGVRSVWEAETLYDALSLAGAAALVGAVALPIVGWVFLRRVPVWLSAVATITGAVVGGVSAEWWHPYNPYSPAPPSALIGIPLGFLVTAVALSIWFRNRVGQVHQPSDSRTAVPAKHE